MFCICCFSHLNIAKILYVVPLLSLDSMKLSFFLEITKEDPIPYFIQRSRYGISLIAKFYLFLDFVDAVSIYSILRKTDTTFYMQYNKIYQNENIFQVNLILNSP